MKFSYKVSALDCTLSLLKLFEDLIFPTFEFLIHKMISDTSEFKIVRVIVRKGFEKGEFSTFQ